MVTLGAGTRIGTLNEHLVILGSTGSGKTVAAKRVIQEAVLDGQTVLAIDRQGDIASMLLPPVGNAHPIQAARWSLAPKRLRVAGRQVGIGTDLAGDPQDCAEQLVGMLQVPPGKALEATALFMRLLGEVNNLDALQDVLTRQDSRFADQLLLRLGILRDGNTGPLLRAPTLDFASLRGLTVVYTGDLGEQEEAFFLSRLLSQTLMWMRRKSRKPFLLFLDEVADLVPPIREPLAKRPLLRLLRQGRKFNLGLILATQNPGDVDYHGLSQCRSWLLGRTTAKQDVEKVADRVKAMAPDAFETVGADLYRLKAGQFYLLTPGACRRVDVEMPMTPHRTLSPREIERLARRAA